MGIGAVVDTAENQGPVGVAMLKADDHFLPDPRYPVAAIATARNICAIPSGYCLYVIFFG
jgi:hypothetical protein